MVSGQARGQSLDDGAGRAVAGIPADAQVLQQGLVDPVQPAEQAFDVSIHDGNIGDVAIARYPTAFIGNAPEIDYIGPEERSPFKYRLEAIVIGGIVAAGYLNAALYIWK